MQLSLLAGELGVARLGPEEAVPVWATRGGFSSVTRTADELSVICLAQSIPIDTRAERGWRCLRVVGQVDFSLTGVLASIADPLAVARISIFALSTFDTDYVLLREADLTRAVEALRAAGHDVLAV
jgi:hypothetical protein